MKVDGSVAMIGIKNFPIRLHMMYEWYTTMLLWKIYVDKNNMFIVLHVKSQMLR